MKANGQKLSTTLAPLVCAWLGLVGLTLVSVGLGQWFHGDGGVVLQLLVAAIVWLKSLLVARKFIETDLAHPFIRRVVLCFVAFTPVALLLTAFFGRQLASWATL